MVRGKQGVLSYLRREPKLKPNTSLTHLNMNNNRSIKSVNPSPLALTYNGPSKLPRSLVSNDVMTTQLNNAGTLTTSAGGVLATVFDAYSQVSTPTDWASWQNLYTEYRILSMEVEFIPWNTYNMPTTNVLPPLYSIIDRANNSPLGSTIGAVSYDSCQVMETGKRFKRIVKMKGAEEAQWIAIGSSPATASRLYVKLYCSGASANTNVYDFVCRVMVQFRGRQ